MYRDDVIYYIRIDEENSRLSWNMMRGSLLQKKREEKGITRKDLAEKLESAGEYQIRKLEIGRDVNEVKAISGTLLLAICKELDIDPKELGYDVATSSNRI
jgi:transcriptional regulator with XRE-family HTH domain